ncbi:Nucleoside-diphosphate-sugar epimerase [Mucilaginibacter pineti]|uniref:Nucleoside-diphosphate-sugar epimerase n=1 Tax=Mucilaginibacter pineti TaxID=1391627 RepID=A0A1G7JJE8_9SPHI|nr:NAD-dependent epimerase/dehydratase family protein [Mucilaginibacter pineti]SDF24995.1 Nucleoside-diphosphate-sugar epimerase [Mucilaginibacter pineti]
MKIFMTGVSGYIGGAIAAKLIENGIEVRGLVREQEKAGLLAARGITPVLGSLDDSDLLTQEARSSDGVINTADSDHRGAIKALIEGLAGSDKPLLHTSGTGLYADDAKGEYRSKVIYDDSSKLTPEPPADEDENGGPGGNRAAIDQLVRDAGKRGIRSVVLCNTNIYGWGNGIKRESIQVPWLIREAIKIESANYIGKGENIWSNVHIDDLVDLYILALEKAVAGSFLFVENGETSFADTAEAIAKRFNLEGPRSWSVEQATEQCGFIYAFLFGSNSRVRSIRARAELNWQPKGKSLSEWIETEA